MLRRSAPHKAASIKPAVSTRRPPADENKPALMSCTPIYSEMASVSEERTTLCVREYPENQLTGSQAPA
jgi:hypothetical protein